MDAPTDMADSTARIIAFASPKGGTGKTLLLLESAYLWASSQRRVLIVDTDAGTEGATSFIKSAWYTNSKGDCDLAVQEQNALYDRWQRSLDAPSRNSEQFIPTPMAVKIAGHEVGLIVPKEDSALPPLEAEPETVREGFDAFLKKAFARYSKDYELILLDLRGGCDAWTRSLLRHTRDIVLLTKPDELSHDHLRKFVADLWDTLSQLQEPCRLHIVVNYATHPSRDAQRALRAVEDELKIRKQPRQPEPLQLRKTRHGLEYSEHVERLYGEKKLPAAERTSFPHTRRFCDILCRIAEPEKKRARAEKGPDPGEGRSGPCQHPRTILSAVADATIFIYRHGPLGYLIGFVAAALWIATGLTGERPADRPYTEIILVLALVPAIFTAYSLLHDKFRARARWHSTEVWHAALPALLVGAAGCIAMWLVSSTSHRFLLTQDRQQDQRELQRYRDDNATLRADRDEANRTSKKEQQRAREAEVKLMPVLQENRQLTDRSADLDVRNKALIRSNEELSARLGKLGRDREQADVVIAQHQALNRERLERLTRLHGIAAESIARARSDQSHAKLALMDARRYIGAFIGRSLTQEEYVERYEQWARALDGRDPSDSDSVAHRRDMRRLGATAFERGDLAWAHKLLTESYGPPSRLTEPVDRTPPLPLTEPVDRTTPDFLYLLACHALEHKTLPGWLADLTSHAGKGDGAIDEGVLETLGRALTDLDARSDFLTWSKLEKLP